MRSGVPDRWLDRPAHLLGLCAAARRRLILLPAGTPSRRLLLDRTAELLAALSQAIAGLALLRDEPDRPRDPHRGFRLRVPDWRPAFANAGRAFLAIAALEAFWIVSAWPNGASAVIWAMVCVTLFGPLAERAYAGAMGYTAGTGIAAVFAAIAAFLVLPRMETFLGFSVALGLFLVPFGALMAQPWRAPLFSAMAAGFVPLVAPANQMAYDAALFLNGALSIVLGGGFGALWFLLLPPMPPPRRARRLLALTLRDLRRLAAGAVRWTGEDWQHRVHGRLAALPDEAEPPQRGQLLAALTLGSELLRLRGSAPRLGLGRGIGSLGAALAGGDVAAATAWLGHVDRLLAARPASGPGDDAALRARGGVVAIAEALAGYPA
jgi:uncharacterized membrane protein YccC